MQQLPYPASSRVTDCRWQYLLVSGWDIGPYFVKDSKADVLIDHARYNDDFFARHFTADTPRIVTVRDAVSWFKSAVRFWHKLFYDAQDGAKKDRKIMVKYEIIFYGLEFPIYSRYIRAR